MIGASKGGYRRSPGGVLVLVLVDTQQSSQRSITLRSIIELKHEYKNIHLGGWGVSPMGVFFIWAVFSLHVRGGHAIFSVWGDLFFCMVGGGIIGLTPPITIFAGASCHKNLSRSWRF